MSKFKAGSRLPSLRTYRPIRVLCRWLWLRCSATGAFWTASHRSRAVPLAAAVAMPLVLAYFKGAEHANKMAIRAKVLEDVKHAEAPAEEAPQA